MIVAPGSASLPSYTFGSNTGVGLFAPTTDILGFSTQGIERFRIDASGNLGIGTTTPQTRLVVNGTSTLFGVDLSGTRIVNLASPLANADAATKAYVDAAGGGGSSSSTLAVQAKVSSLIGLPVFGGDGSDGDVTISSPTSI
ncbi:hypothetical protein HYV91_03355 [Candidatus Wolfebacteria bacterium]|nr:hypothetical protein [Candidatus Wolfebacteria bacterium]